MQRTNSGLTEALRDDLDLLVDVSEDSVDDDADCLLKLSVFGVLELRLQV